MKTLLTLLILLVPSFLVASEPPKFYLNADGKVEKRVSEHDAKIAELEKKVQDLLDQQRLLKAELAELRTTKATATPVVSVPKPVVNPNYVPEVLPTQETYTIVNGTPYTCSNGSCRPVTTYSPSYSQPRTGIFGWRK